MIERDLSSEQCPLLTDSGTGSGAYCRNEVSEPTSARPLSKALTMRDGIGVSVAIIVGSGIFASPGQILSHVGSTGLSLVVWIVAGIVALCSSLVYAELSPAIPTAGGDRDYISLAFGPSVAFAYTLSMFFVIRPGAQGLLTVTFARYVSAALWPEETISDGEWRVKLIAIAGLSSVAALNCVGVKETSIVQGSLTVSKLLLLLLLAAAAVSSLTSAEGRGDAAQNLGPGAFSGSDVAGLGPALVGALWAFDGWNGMAFLAEELHDPRSLPVIIVLSMLTVAGLYVAINLCYCAALPAEAILESTTIAVDMASSSLGPWAFYSAAVLVAMSALGAANGSIMCGSRLFFAAARDGELPRALAAVSPGGRTPYAAILANLAVSVGLLCLPGSSFDSLVAYFGAASWLWYGTTGASLVKLRRDRPNLRRVFRCPLACAALTVCVSAFLVGSSVWDARTRRASVWSLCLAVAPLFLHAAHLRIKRPTAPDAAAEPFP